MCLQHLTGFPWWLSGKESARQCRRHRFNPWVRKILWRMKWQPTPVFLPGKSHGWRTLAGYSSWGCKESDTTYWLNNSNSRERGWECFCSGHRLSLNPPAQYSTSACSQLCWKSWNSHFLIKPLQPPICWVPGSLAESLYQFTPVNSVENLPTLGVVYVPQLVIREHHLAFCCFSPPFLPGLV